MKGDIYLVRHGHLDRGPAKRYVGQTDYPLSALGISQAEHLRDLFCGIEFKRIVASDLSRTMTTAEIIAQRQMVPVEAHPGFREVRLGSWEGQRIDDIKSQHPDAYEQRGLDLAGHRPPGGENFYDLSERAIPSFRQVIEESQGPLLIATHVGVIRVILCHVLEIPHKNLFLLHHDYGAYTLLKNSETQIQLMQYNCR